MLHDDHEIMLHRVAEVVRARVPDEAMLLVASGGHDELLRLSGRAREFPDPGSPSSYGASGLAAIAHLEAQRA